MKRQVRNSSRLSPSRPITSFSRVRSFLAAALLAATGFAVPTLSAQVADRILRTVDTSQLQALPNHHPLWASSANDTGPLLADLPLNQLTLVLSRSPQQQAAFEQFLADQQNSASPEHHHWLTPNEVGERFGLSDQDISTITGWLQSQGLRVNWVSPSRIFIGFGGTASDVSRAFQTEMHTYTVHGQQRLSVNSDPMLPVAIAPAIQAVRGLYSIDEQPAHHIASVESATPQLTGSSGSHIITPKDFDTIYDVPSSVTGAGVTIGIVGWSRTNFTDFDNFRSGTGVTFADPTEVVPTAFGGIDPGPAYTAPQAASVSIGGQSEATLDVTRAGSVAPGAYLLLVVSSQAGTNDGIGADAQYLVNTTPVPAQVMSISFGACEASAGSGGVAFWDNLFQTAAAEGISVFVSSGDSGAAGCDTAFSAPPVAPMNNSPNYICSSSYATCAGGTQFADTASPSTYWSSTNGTGYLSALSYIPEGAWNESTLTYVAATGGGVSTVIATPSWQTGAGVPSERTGRYTPDVSFSASEHDGYFGCLAAAQLNSCVVLKSSFSFIAFSGTSAAAPGMAGAAALLDQQLGGAQGNLNLHLYPMAASVPLAFHDTTVASSGVLGCTSGTISICNNTVPSGSGNGNQGGFLVGAGYDEATGLGSLDVAVFLNNYQSASRITPTVTVAPSPAGINTAQSTSVAVTVSGGSGNPTPTGSVTLTSGSYASAVTALVAGKATITVPGSSLAVGVDTLTAAYSSDSTYNSATGTNTVTVTQGPTFAVGGTAVTVTAGATTGNTSKITVTPAFGFTGSVTLTATVSNSTGTQFPPTPSFSSPNPVSITSASAVTSTLTIATTASKSSCVAANEIPRGLPWYARGGAVLACLLLFGFAPRRRKVRAMLAMMLLFVALAGAMLACGGGGGGSACNNVVTSGTTAGSYTITITATSGSTTTINTIALTVQ